jgi:site-specific recombinase XerD
MDPFEQKQNSLAPNERFVPSTQQIPTDYIKRATADNTRKAYQQDIKHFENWGGKLPTDTASIIHYLHDHADSLNTRTLARRLTALRQFHRYQGFPDPTAHPSVQKTLRGIQNTHGKPKQRAPALRLEQLAHAINMLSPEDTLANARNRCLLTLGYFGALRGSELLNIQVTHLQFSEQGITLQIPKSKTDQAGEGLSCAIPKLGNAMCPFFHTQYWLERAGLSNGVLFTNINRWDQIGTKSMTISGLNKLIKNIARRCEWRNPEKYSSHSLRRGLATSASGAGASFKSIMRQGRWRHEGTVLQYIEEGQAFEDNAVNALF